MTLFDKLILIALIVIMSACVSMETITLGEYFICITLVNISVIMARIKRQD